MTAPRARFGAAALAVLACVLISGCLPVDVRRLAADEMAGRDAGTPGGQLAREYLLDRLAPLAGPIHPGVSGDAGYLQPFIGGTNILGVIEGTELPDEYVILGAHYDHVGVGGCTTAVAADRICNGATDNATGVGAALMVAGWLADTPPRRSVVIALWDGEEDNLKGSRVYRASPLVPLADTVTYVNLDILGQNLLPSLRSTTFAVGSESGGPLLEVLADAVGASSGLDVGVLHEVFGGGRSDHATFLDAGVPSIFLSDSTGSCYHKAQDQVEVVDFAKVEKQAQMAHQMVRLIADADGRATFTPSTGVPRYRDAVAVLAMYDRSASDIGRFSASRQTQLNSYRTQLRAIVDQGADAFDTADATVVGQAARTSLTAISALPCNGFLADG